MEISIKKSLFHAFLYFAGGASALYLGRMIFAIYTFGDFVFQKFVNKMPEGAYVPMASDFSNINFLIACVVTAVLLYVLVQFLNNYYGKLKVLSKLKKVLLLFTFFFIASSYLLAAVLFFYAIPFAEISLLWFVEYNVFVALFCTAIAQLAK